MNKIHVYIHIVHIPLLQYVYCWATLDLFTLERYIKKSFACLLKTLSESLHNGGQKGNSLTFNLFYVYQKVNNSLLPLSITEMLLILSV